MALALRPDEVLAGESPAAQRLREQVERIGRTPLTTVLLSSERGLAPELVARAIHSRSSVAAGPFRSADCRALGAERDAAAVLTEDGALVAAARGGTLFLEEVAALDASLQARLQDLLERRASGAPGPQLRVVASTSEDLEARVQAGRFREDLLYRLNVLAVRIPSLSERAGDLAGLSDRILRGLKRALGLRCDLSPEAAERLEEHTWEGNLLELEAVLTLAALRAEDGAVHPAHLPLAEMAAVHPREELIPLPPGQRSLRALEEAMIRRVLQEEGGNRSRSARVLGINRTTLYNKLRLYGIR